MKTEATATTPNPKTNNSIANKMAFDMYPTISGKQQDPVREVVMKYIDYFLPDQNQNSFVHLIQLISKVAMPIPPKYHLARERFLQNFRNRNKKADISHICILVCNDDDVIFILMINNNNSSKILVEAH
uniref:Uncharacterized protein n=1 Tax=Glossina morsitans morsitans TaxID=37546 RepID=A0A1B0G0T4_GLOMM